MVTKILMELDKGKVSYQLFHHEPILDFATARAVGQRLGWQGTESKSLLLKDQENKYYLFLTEEKGRFDQKRVRAIIGKKLSLCTPKEIKATFHLIPGCVPPFLPDQEITYLVDKQLLHKEAVIWSPGEARISIIVSGEDLKRVIMNQQGELYWL